MFTPITMPLIDVIKTNAGKNIKIINIFFNRLLSGNNNAKSNSNGNDRIAATELIFVQINDHASLFVFPE